MTRSDELWDVEVQARPAAEVAARAEAGIAEEWARIWELPLHFYRERYQAAGLGPAQVPALDDIPLAAKAALRADDREHPPFGRYRAQTLDQVARIGSSTGTT